jgi:hypothetical protein
LTFDTVNETLSLSPGKKGTIRVKRDIRREEREEIWIIREEIWVKREELWVIREVFRGVFIYFSLQFTFYNLESRI